MTFHLDHTPAPFSRPLSHDSSIMLLGSCFSENIGQLFIDHAFHAKVNPGGIQFNPASISGFLTRVLEEKLPGDDTFLMRGESVFNFNHHSSISASSAPQLKNTLKELYSGTKEDLSKSDVLFITFGTAFVYVNKKLDQVVSNCHKQTHDLFEKKLLAIEKIAEDFNSLLRKLKILNPKLNVVFTVSPVKHLRDGLEANSRSKAILLESIHRIIEGSANCHYFPAFELVTDDLRDYRFYASDMAHPNKEAIKYVWDKLSGAYFSETTRSLNQEIVKLNTAKEHRPLHANQAEEKRLQEFIDSQKKRILSINPRLEL
jgi:hypothetical protein